MKKYWTSLTSTYVPDWSAPEAIREILQNFLDSPAPFEYDFNGSSLEFINKGITLHQSTILMGSSSKRDELDSVGGKGEGYKLACLVLFREGHGVTIYNGDRIWTPVIEYNTDYEANCLVFNETYGSGNDLRFVVDGVDSTLTEEIVDKCLYLRDDLGEVLEGTRGRVFKDIPNKLFVGGLYVCEINSKYSYDFHPRYLPLNRDRKSVDSWNLGNNTTQLLEEVMPARELCQLTLAKTVDAGGWYARFTSTEVAEEMYQITKETLGEDVVVCNDYVEQEKLQKRGYKNVQVIGNDKQYKLVKEAPSYQEFLDSIDNEVEPEDTRTPVEMLEDIINSVELSSYAQDEFSKLIEIFKERGVSWND